jgi:hypothetical protein
VLYNKNGFYSLDSTGKSTKNIDIKIENELKEIKNYQTIVNESYEIQKKFKKHLLGISVALHPVNKDTGIRKGVSLIESEVNICMDEIRKIFSDINLSENSFSYFKKAERAIPYLLSSVQFFCTNVYEMVKALKLTKEQEYLFHANLVPAAYLRRVSKQEKSDEKMKIRTRADEIEKKGLELFSDEQKNIILKSAKDAADMYQRSSSVVEGRNSTLSLQNQALVINPA